jgi:DNA-binding MarR family transcriptional regulator
MKKNSVKISDLSRSLIEIAWHFGPKGLNGECCDDISMPEFIALDKISNTQYCPVQEIGQRLGFTKSGATRIVNSLEKKGYVKKMTSSEDARVCCVVITASGEKIIKDADERYLEKLNQLLAKMPENFRLKAEELFNSMARALKG